MEFRIQKNVLEKTLNGIVKLIPPKSTYTVLQNIIIEAKGKNLSIEGTDLDVFVKKVIPAEIKEEGKVLLPGKKILEITREANVEELNFKLKELNLQILAGNARFNIPALDYQEFPEVPKFPEKKWFEMSVGEVEEMVDTTIFMVSRDLSRRPMNGILIHLKDNALRFVSTDGARLALNKRELKQADGEIIVGTKVFELIDFEKPEEKIQFFMEERMVGIKFLETTVIARLIEGPYPNYDGAIPKTFSGKCTVEKDLLDGALKRMILVAPPQIKSVKFDFHEKGIILSAASPDIGEAKEEVACAYDGEKIGIWFNASYLLEIIRHIKANSLEFQLTSASTATLLQPKEDDKLLYLLMPLRIDSFE
jgi:DNA polymerase-3 subunit beta